MRVDKPRLFGKLSVSLILYQGGSSTTIRLYVTKERKAFLCGTKLVVFNQIIKFKMKTLEEICEAKVEQEFLEYSYVEGERLKELIKNSPDRLKGLF